MEMQVTLSPDGQIVIPKDVLEALGLRGGQVLDLSVSAWGEIVMKMPPPPRETISYEEFRRRVPRYEGPPATIEEMNAAVDRMFAERGRP